MSTTKSSIDKWLSTNSQGSEGLPEFAEFVATQTPQGDDFDDIPIRVFVGGTSVLSSTFAGGGERQQHDTWLKFSDYWFRTVPCGYPTYDKTKLCYLVLLDENTSPIITK